MRYTQAKFEVNEIFSLEEEMMTMTSSYMYPPTANSFCLMFLSTGFPSISTPMSTVIESCQFMIELATCGETVCFD